MQDKGSNDHFNFPVDQGWEQMQAQLDEVMPQKRRPFLWWWLLGLLLVGVVGGYAWSQINLFPGSETEGNPEPIESLRNDEPVAQTEIESTLHSNTTAEQSIDDTAAEEVPAVNAQAPIQDIERTEITRLTSSIAPKETHSTTTQPNSNQISEELEVIAASEHGESNAVAASSEPADLTEINNPPSVDPLKTRSVIAIVDQLQASPIQPLLTEKVESTDLSLIDVKQPASPAIYVEAFGGESLVDPFPSIAGGVGMEHKLGRYQIHRTQLFNGLSRSDAVQFESSIGSGVQNGNFYDINAAYRNLETKRFNAYAQVGYRIHPRIHIGLGAQSAYIFNASARLSGEDALSQDPNGSEDLAGVRVDLYDESIAAVSYSQFSNAAAPLDVRRWQWTAMGSVSYRLHPAWSFEVQYLRHLTKWPAQGETFGGPHNLQFGVRYYLRK